MIAAIEHYTAFLGDWVLNAGALDAKGADPAMLDLLRWHGAEEVEHRSVAFDLFVHLDGGYRRRVRTWATAFTALVFLWQRGTRYFMAHDPSLTDGKAAFGDSCGAGGRACCRPRPDAARHPAIPQPDLPPLPARQHRAGRRLPRPLARRDRRRVRCRGPRHRRRLRCPHRPAYRARAPWASRPASPPAPHWPAGHCGAA